MAIKVVTGPTDEPVSVDDMKLYLRVDTDTEDAMISALIVAAREYCADFQNRSYIIQTLELTLDHFPCNDYRPYMYDFPFYAPPIHHHTHRHRNRIDLPLPPIQSVTSVTYTDDTGVTTTLDPSTYIVDTDSEPGRIVPAAGQEWPVVRLQPINGVRVRYVAGYGTADNVPQAVKQAMMMLVAHWYENREAVVIMGSRSVGTAIEFAVKALLTSQRVVPT